MIQKLREFSSFIPIADGLPLKTKILILVVATALGICVMGIGFASLGGQKFWWGGVSDTIKNIGETGSIIMIAAGALCLVGVLSFFRLMLLPPFELKE